MTARDEYYIFQTDYPKLDVLRRFITKGQVDEAVAWYKGEGLSPDAYIKGVKPGTWVPLLYQCLQDQRFNPLIKQLLRQGGNVLKLPDGDDVTPLIYICDAAYLSYLLKKGAAPVPVNPRDVYHCFIYGRAERVQKLLDHGCLTHADIDRMQATYPTLKYTMVDTGVKYLTYYYGAQVKKGNTIVKQTTDDLIGRYLALFALLEGSVDRPCLDLCVDYYLYELLAYFKKRCGGLPKGLLPPVYGQKGAKAAFLRPLLNDYRYEQTCLTLDIEPTGEIYEGYNRC